MPRASPRLPLQRCRSACAAEGDRRGFPLHGPPSASTVPQRVRCGRVDEAAAELLDGQCFNGAAARALRKGPAISPAAKASTSLQRCRSACAAEGLRERVQDLRRDRASTVPAARALRKGGPAARSSEPASCFNGAAARALRKGRRSGRQPPRPRCFNGAAARALRKGTGQSSATRPLRMLQRCRSACAAEGLVRRPARRPGQRREASTVPQRVRCGRGRSRSTNKGEFFCFNGAAARALRKGWFRGIWVSLGLGCFNGAAARALRKASVSSSPATCTTMLQRCRSACAAEGIGTGMRKPQDTALQRCRSACAAEGDPERCREDAACALQRCRSACAAEGWETRTVARPDASLQRCRSACAAEGSISQGGRFVRCLASTVPQRVRCGRAAPRHAAVSTQLLQRCRSACAAEGVARVRRARPRGGFNGAAARALRKARGRPRTDGLPRRRFNGAAARALRKAVAAVSALPAPSRLQRCRSACAAEGSPAARRPDPRTAPLQRCRSGALRKARQPRLRHPQGPRASTVPQRVRCGRRRRQPRRD